MLKTLCGFFFCLRSYEALIGIVSHDTFDWLSDKQSRFATASGLESGSIDTTTDSLSPEQRDRIYQSYVRNHYKAHLKEILLIVQNEYTDWDSRSHSNRVDIRDQVSTILTLIGKPPLISECKCPLCNSITRHPMV